MTDEGREVRKYTVRRNVGSADRPRTAGGRVGFHPARIHGHRDERLLLRPIPWRHPGGGDGPDAAHVEVMLTSMADRWNLLEWLDPDLVGQRHDQTPAVIQMPVPEYVVLVREQTHQLAGRASGFLEQRDIRLAPPHHLREFSPRLHAFADIPAHDPDHSARPPFAGPPGVRTAGMPPAGRRGADNAALLRSRPGSVWTQSRCASHHPAIQAGRLITTAQAAIATGPSSPTTSDPATVAAPRPAPAVQVERR